MWYRRSMGAGDLIDRVDRFFDWCLARDRRAILSAPLLVALMPAGERERLWRQVRWVVALSTPPLWLLDGLRALASLLSLCWLSRGRDGAYPATPARRDEPERCTACGGLILGNLCLVQK